MNVFGFGCAYVQGEYVPIDDAAIPITDVGFVHCDCTYDVVSVWQGRFFRLEEHLDRLLRGCERLRLTPPASRESIRRVLHECVARTGLREAYVMMVVTRGVPVRGERDLRRLQPRLYAFAVPYIWAVRPAAQLEGTDAIVVDDTVRIPPRSVDPTVKNFHWGDLTRAQFEAYDRGGHLPILTDGADHVTEGPGINVFAVLDRQLLTPRLGVLEGITRRTILELAGDLGYPAMVDDLTTARLRTADEIFLTSTAGGVMPVRSLDHVQIGSGGPGPITMQLRDAYWALHDDARFTVEVDYDLVARPTAGS